MTMPTDGFTVGEVWSRIEISSPSLNEITVTWNVAQILDRDVAKAAIDAGVAAVVDYLENTASYTVSGVTTQYTGGRT